MIKKSIFLLTAILITLTINSCNFLIQWYMGVKQPTILKYQKVKQFADKHKIPIDTTLVVSDTSYISYLFSNQSFSADDLFHIITKEQRAIDVSKCLEGMAMVTYALYDSTESFVQLDTNLAVQFQQIAQTIQKEKVPLNFTSHEYTILFFWTTWLGKLSYQKIAEIKQVIAEKEHLYPNRVQLIPINFDFIQEQGWTRERLEKFNEATKTQ